ncbi:hypothetical protein ACWDSJ_24955 [Nocardia sp. NPDC003482]
MSYALHLIPVGISLNDQLKKREIPLSTDDRRTLVDALKVGDYGPHNPVRGKLRAATDPATRVMRTDSILGEAIPVLRSVHQTPKWCSEWQSLHTDRTDAVAAGGHDGDAYLFLATDTDQGLLTATALAAGTAAASPVHYLDDPTDLTARAIRLRPNDIHVCRIPGLDLEEAPVPPESVWTALGAIGHIACETARPGIGAGAGTWRVVLHLSGGYKALLPALLAMGEAIRSVFEDPDVQTRASISAWVLHETSAGQRIEVPVRYLAGRPYEDLYRLRDDLREGHTPQPGNLIGSCLTRDLRLTSFGRVMLAVLPATRPEVAP